MMQSLFPKGDIAMRLIHFLEYADMIKFAGVEAGSARKGDDILRLGELASAVEEECRLRDRDKQEDADVGYLRVRLTFCSWDFFCPGSSSPISGRAGEDGSRFPFPYGGETPFRRAPLVCDF